MSTFPAFLLRLLSAMLLCVGLALGGLETNTAQVRPACCTTTGEPALPALITSGARTGYRPSQPSSTDIGTLFEPLRRPLRQPGGPGRWVTQSARLAAARL